MLHCNYRSIICTYMYAYANEQMNESTQARAHVLIYKYNIQVYKRTDKKKINFILTGTWHVHLDVRISLELDSLVYFC